MIVGFAEEEVATADHLPSRSCVTVSSTYLYLSTGRATTYMTSLRTRPGIAIASVESAVLDSDCRIKSFA
jgi:hypothetical protein